MGTLYEECPGALILSCIISVYLLAVIIIICCYLIAKEWKLCFTVYGLLKWSFLDVF
jgi:hypothetical protein